MSTSICPICQNSLRPNARFCGSCGSDISKIVTPSTGSVKSKPKQDEFDNKVLVRIQDTLISMFLDGDDPIENCGALVHEFEEDFGVPPKVTLDLIESLSKRFGPVAPNIQVSYDRSLACDGIALGNTILTLSVENLSAKTLDTVKVLYVNPEDKAINGFPEIRVLSAGKKKYVDTSIQFRLPGKHYISKLFIITTTISGNTQHFSISRPIIMEAENSHSMHANIFNQSIKTVGGGVVDNSSRSQASDHSTSVWEPLQLRRMSVDEMEEISQFSADSVIEQSLIRPDTTDCFSEHSFNTDQANTSLPDDSFYILNNSSEDVREDTLVADHCDDHQAEELVVNPSCNSDLDESILGLINAEELPHKISNYEGQEAAEAIVEEFSGNRSDQISETLTDLFQVFSALNRGWVESEQVIEVVNTQGRQSDRFSSVKSLLSDFNLIALCKCVLPPVDLDKSLSTAFNLFVAVTTQGTFLICHNDECGYQLSRLNAFISWHDYFNKNQACVHVRDEVPDFWIGTELFYLTPGTYLRFEEDIPAWINFRDQFKGPIEHLVTRLKNIFI
jgi:hypothetical protein